MLWVSFLWMAVTIASCDKDNTPVPQGLPEITSMLASTDSTAVTIAGTLQSDGGSAISEWGVCWGTTPGSAEYVYKMEIPVSENGFRITLSGLDPFKAFYFRCFAVNGKGTGYSRELSFFTGDKELTASEMPDSAFRRALLELCDWNTDGKLMVSETAEVFNLDLTEKGISSLQGLQYLYILRTLTLAGNKLTTLHVSMPGVIRISCNEKLLTSLNVSGCPILESLNSHDGSIDALVVKNCPVMRRIDCSNNRLRVVELSGMSSLLNLDCSGNLLTSLGLDHCPYLEDLNCRDNRLTELDVSTCPGLSGLICDDNSSLTKIYISPEQAALADESGNIDDWSIPFRATYVVKGLLSAPQQESRRSVRENRIRR